MFCGRCGAEINETAKFCGYCGEKIISNTNNICRKCGVELDENDKFCTNCGEKVAAEGFVNQQSGLVNCPYCGSPVSTEAKTCSSCGCSLVSGNSSGVIRIKLGSLFGTVTRQTVSINDENGQELWAGRAGQVAEIYFDREKKIIINYHIAANAWPGSCIAIINPANGANYATTVKRRALETRIVLEKI